MAWRIELSDHARKQLHRLGLAGLSGVSVGIFADFDNDGFKEAFVSRTFEPNQLFHNDRRIRCGSTSASAIRRRTASRR